MKNTSSSAASTDAGSAGTGETVLVRRADSEGLTGSPPANTPAAEQALVYAPVSEAEAAGLALSPGQCKAIEKLTSGSTAVEAAMAAGVGRTTLYRWLKEDPVFIAAYNAWQRDVVATARGKMLALADLAVGAVAKAMSRGDGKLALRVLERMGVAARPTEGETDVEEVKRKQEHAARMAELERREETVELARKTRDVIMGEIVERVDDLGPTAQGQLARREKVPGEASREKGRSPAQGG